MERNDRNSTMPQYSLGEVLGIWALAAIPMGILGWLVAPALAPEPGKPGLERLAVPWSILGSTVSGCLFYAFPARRFRRSWLGIIAHSGQSVFFTLLILGLVLGLT